MKNEYISKYLKYYFELSSAPSYAVMLSGEWGCGKTWYINKLVDEFSQSIGKDKKDIFIYISLYGMKDITEIDAAIFQNLHPFLASKPMAIAGSLLRGAAKIGLNLNLDFNNDNKNDVKANVDGKPFFDTLSEMVSSNNEKIMIFDDLERCYIKHQELFGYFNRFVEHQNQKVVLISHEGELFKKNNSHNEESPKKYKEKLIGATFFVEGDIDEAFISFSQLVDKNCQKLLSKYQNTIYRVCKKVGKNNLRNLRQAIISFPYFLKQFPDRMISMLECRHKSICGYQNENSEFEYIIRFFFYIFLEEKSGSIDKDNWEEAASIFNSKEISYDEFLIKSEEEKKQIREEVLFSTIIHDGIFGSDWYNVVIQNANYYNQLKSIYENMLEVEKTKSKAVWVLLEGLIDLSKAEFKNKYKEMLSDIENDNIENVGELLHSFGILLHLAKNKIIKKSIKSIKNIIRKNLIKNTIDGQYEVIKNHFRQDAWAGYQFYEVNSEEMKEMISYFYKLNDEVGNKNLNIEFQKLIKDLGENIDVICNEIILVGNNGRFSNKPFFSYIKKRDKFFNEVFSLPTRQMHRFMGALKERYMLKYSNGRIEEQFIPEKDLIKNFITYVENKKEKISSNFNPAIKKYDYLHTDLLDIKKQFDKLEDRKE